MSLLLTSIVAGATAITGAAIVYRMINPVEYPTIPSSIEETKSDAFDAAHEHAEPIDADVIRVPDGGMEPRLPQGVFAVVAKVPVSELNKYDVVAYLGEPRDGIVMARYLYKHRDTLVVRRDADPVFKHRGTESLDRNKTLVSTGVYRGKVVAYYDWVEARKAG